MIIRPLRSDEPGKRPTPNAENEGELFLNRADKQIGFRDPDGKPVDLVAVRAFSKYSAYKAGDLVSYNGNIYSAHVDVSVTVPPSDFNPNRWRNIAHLSPNQPSMPVINAGNQGQALVVDGAGNPVWGATFNNMSQEIFGGKF